MALLWLPHENGIEKSRKYLKHVIETAYDVAVCPAALSELQKEETYAGVAEACETIRDIIDAALGRYICPVQGKQKPLPPGTPALIIANFVRIKENIAALPTCEESWDLDIAHIFGEMIDSISRIEHLEFPLEDIGHLSVMNIPRTEEYRRKTLARYYWEAANALQWAVFCAAGDVKIKQVDLRLKGLPEKRFGDLIGDFLPVATCRRCEGVFVRVRESQQVCGKRCRNRESADARIARLFSKSG